MKSILMSIKPDYAHRILEGTKKFEYRRIKCQHPIDLIYIYATSPIKKIIGQVTVESVITSSLDTMWESTKSFSGINKKDFYDYFVGKDIAHAYKLVDVEKYSNPKNLNEFGIDRAPQSFVYVNTSY